MISDIQTSLENLGYRLTDCGSSWRTSALYRGGKNSTSVMIYKDSGVWYDFAQGIGPVPYKKLVELTLGTDDPENLEKFLVTATEFTAASPPNEYIEMSKIYPESVLDNLLPSHKLYLDKGISERVLKLYRCGLAQSGKLYRRIVFPIFNQDKQIHGFSGRKVDNDTDAPKWKHLGKRREWVYPYYMAPMFEISCKANPDIILVESIGDSLALSEHRMENHLVLFGLVPSSALIGKLIEINPKKIIIATNNDVGSEINRGQLAAVKAYISLSAVFDREKLKIKLPLANDFGDMHQAGIDFRLWEDGPDGTDDALRAVAKLLEHPKVSFTASQRDALINLTKDG